MIYFYLYLIDFLYNLNFLAMLLLIFAIVGIIILLGLACSQDAFHDKSIIDGFKITGAIIIISLLFCTFIPSQKTMYSILAVYIGKQINAQVQITDKLQKVSKLIDLKLDDLIKEEINE